MTRIVTIGRIAITALPVLFLTLFLLYPLVSIMRLGLAPATWAAIAADRYYQQVAWFSFWQAILSTLLTLLVGMPAAFVFARLEFPLRRVLRASVLVPFVLPTVVVATGFVAFLGPNSLISDLFRMFGLPAPQLLGTLGAVMLAHVFYNTGLVVRLVGSLWQGIDPALEQAAATLGLRWYQVLLRITLPLLLPAIGAAAMLTFIYTFGSFGIVLLLGGPRMATLEVAIYRQISQSLNIEVAAGLAFLQALVTLLAGWGYAQIEQTSSRANLWARPARRATPTRIVHYLLLFGMLAGMIFLLAPMPILAWRSFTLPSAPGLPALFTFDYYRMLGENRRGSLFFVTPLQAIINSFGFATSTMLLTLLLALPAAYSIAAQQTARTQPRQAYLIFAQQFRNLLFILPIGISAVMLGLGTIVAWGRYGWLTSPLLIPIAHTLLAFPFVVRSLVPALTALNPRFREAARTLGVGMLRVRLLIELRLIAPALLSAAMFAFTVSLGDYGAALLLARPEFPTLPLVIARLLGQPGAANYGQALALSTILMAISIGAFLVIEWRSTG
jgi:thiamine transport system permease protein